MKIFIILLSSILVNNYIFAKFLGICPFLGVSKKVQTAFGMGLAVTFVMVLASAITYILQYFVLVPFGIEYMQTIVFILVIASLVQFVEMALGKISPNLYNSLGVYLPLITTNCAVLGVAIINIQSNFNFVETLFNGFGAAVGFTLAIVLFAGVRERLELSNVSKVFEGFPIALISASLISLAFLGFSGLL